MRGVSNSDGYCPFWESLGKRFFQIPFPDADILSARNKEFIADLMPKFPIYLEFLSDEAQSVIGKPHPETAPAMALLLKQGFSKTDQVDIFDAGPKLTSKWKKLAIVKESKQIRHTQHLKTLESAALLPYIACSKTASTWRAGIVHGPKNIRQTTGFLTESLIRLNVKEGDPIVVSPLYSGHLQGLKGDFL
jgi:arginine N-succinyltransferase